MKGFLAALLISTTTMFVVVYLTTTDPYSGTTSALDAIETETETSTEEPTESTSSNVSYLERIKKGDTLFDNGYYSLAVVEYQFATQIEPDLGEPFQKLGTAYFLEGDYESALPNLKLASQRGANDEATQLMLGQTLVKEGNYLEAKDHFNTLTENITVLYYRGILSAYFDEYEIAQDYFNRVINDGSIAEYSQNTANYLAAMTEYSLAEDGRESYRKTLMARSMAQTNEPGMAIDLLYDVLRSDPDYRDAWVILGYSYLTLEQYDNAQDALFKAVELDPSKPESRYFLGLSYFGLDDYTSALTQIELALESGFEPKVQAYQKLGDTAVLTQDYQKAAEAYENVLVLNSSDVELYIRPIWLYIDYLNNVGRAIELGKQATEEHPDEALSFSLLGWAQTMGGYYEDAEESLNYALLLDYDNAAAHLNFGRLYELQDELENAKEHYKQAYTLAPEDSVGDLAADLYNRIIERETAEATAAEGEATTANESQSSQNSNTSS